MLLLLLVFRLNDLPVLASVGMLILIANSKTTPSNIKNNNKNDNHDHHSTNNIKDNKNDNRNRSNDNSNTKVNAWVCPASLLGTGK